MNERKMSNASPRRFLLDQCHGMVLQATVQRAKIYNPRANENLRNQFRIGLRRILDEAAAHYRRRVDEAAHTRRIGRIASTLSGRHARALRGGRFRIGPAQKALNLFLKYQWSAGWIAEPPHCPFDAQIIKLLPASVSVPWTELDDLDAYRRLVTAARARASGQSLARWELAAYDRVSAAAQRGRPA
ncbi:MAG: hypothetical protein JNL44_13445 [Gemmatimonadetes bacterium]|nr:hypothetical protein [Gemmatimonadota bacterium]